MEIGDTAHRRAAARGDTRRGRTIEADDDTDRLVRAVETALGVSFTGGNEIRVLRNGDEIFPAMLRAIEEAREYVDLLTYIYWAGEIAERFAIALAERARAGVDVRVILDAIGAMKMSRDLVELMEEAGVTVHWFRKPTWRVWRTSHRTHRKVLVCDGRVGFTGGIGIAEEWCGDARDPTEWRDTHFEVRGPAVAGLQASFTGNWVEGMREASELTRRVSREEPGSAAAMVVRSVAAIGWSDVATLLWTLLSQARRRVRIATAYFVPDDRTCKLLCETARRGVDVEVLVPGPYTDLRVCQLARAGEVAPLLEAGVRIHRYQPTMMHAKIVLVDDAVALVGSPNVNHRSMMHDDETCLVIADREVIETLDRHYDEDVSRSKPTTLEQWDERSLGRRALQALAQIARPYV